MSSRLEHFCSMISKLQNCKVLSLAFPYKTSKKVVPLAKGGTEENYRHLGLLSILGFVSDFITTRKMIRLVNSLVCIYSLQLTTHNAFVT